MKKEILTQKYLKECLTYFPDTGKFIWNERPRNHFKCDLSFKAFSSRYLGKECGTLNKRHKYTYVRIDVNRYRIHRLAFLYMNGEMPKDQVDHINHDRQDNRWSNLRETSSKENSRNQSKRINNTSGHTGVYFDKNLNKWRAGIMIERTTVHLGQFENIEDAVRVRKSAEIKYGFHENHGK